MSVQTGKNRSAAGDLCSPVPFGVLNSIKKTNPYTAKAGEVLSLSPWAGSWRRFEYSPSTRPPIVFLPAPGQLAFLKLVIGHRNFSVWLFPPVPKTNEEGALSNASSSLGMSGPPPSSASSQLNLRWHEWEGKDKRGQIERRNGHATAS